MNTVTSIRQAEASNGPFPGELQPLKEWMYEKISDYMDGNILELFIGRGQFSDLFIQPESSVAMSIPMPINFVEKIDTLEENFERTYSEFLHQYDSIFALNMIDFGPLPRNVILNIGKLLKPGGYLVTWFPSQTALYGQLDQAFNNWHRSNKATIRKLLPTGIEIVKMRYFNITSLKTVGSAEQAGKFDELVTTFIMNEESSKYRGVSMIMVAQLKM